MLCSAQDNHWNEVAVLAKEYATAAEVLRSWPDLPEQSETEQRELLARILDTDAAIRTLISPEMGRLGKVLGDLRRQRSLIEAYSGHSSPS